MRRGIRNAGIVAGATALSLALVGGALASPGQGAENGKRKGKRVVKLEGRLAAAPTTSVTVKKKNGKTLTCAVGAATIADWAVAGAQARLTCANSAAGPVVQNLDPIGTSVQTADAFEAEGRGTIAALTQPGPTTTGTITISQGSSQLICTIPAASTLATGFAVNDAVEVQCVLADNVWTLTRIQKQSAVVPGGGENEDDDHGKGGNHDGLEVKGAISALTQPDATTAGSITIGVAPSAVTCVIPAASTLTTAFKVGDTVEMKCSTDGTQWTLTRIHTEDDAAAENENEVKGAIAALTAPSATLAGSVTVGTTTCGVPIGSTLLTGFAVGQMVEIECKQDTTGLVLTKIKAEDGNEHGGGGGRGRGGSDD